MHPTLLRQLRRIGVSDPDHLPTPSVLDDLPVLPANHAVPPPLPQ